VIQKAELIRHFGTSIIFRAFMSKTDRFLQAVMVGIGQWAIKFPANLIFLSPKKLAA
jgi:hypothetical protein